MEDVEPDVVVVGVSDSEHEDEESSAHESSWSSLDESGAGVEEEEEADPVPTQSTPVWKVNHPQEDEILPILGRVGAVTSAYLPQPQDDR